MAQQATRLATTSTAMHSALRVATNRELLAENRRLRGLEDLVVELLRYGHCERTLLMLWRSPRCCGGRRAMLPSTEELKRVWVDRVRAHAFEDFHFQDGRPGFALIRWANQVWCEPDMIDEAWKVLCNCDEGFPWKQHARAGLEYWINPDTGEPDRTRRALISKLYEAENGVAAPWAQWEEAFGH